MAATRGDRKPYSRPAARPRGAEGEWLHDRAPGAARGRARITSSNRNSFNNDTDEQASTSSEPSAKLIVSNLHYEITPKDLAAIFGTKGTLVREPLIRYDRSGRSSGVAIITYETAAEASAAKREYNERLCKDQPMTIEFYNPAPKRMASAPSLISRIQKPALLDRLGEDKNDRNDRIPQGPGPIRTRRQPRHSTGNAPNTNNPNTNRPPRNPRGRKGPEPRKANKPVTAEDLDKELDSFMKEDMNAAAVPPAVTNGGGSGIVEQDVEMA